MLNEEFDPVILKTSGGDTAKLYPYGAHLTSWCTADGIERLFLSQRTKLQSGTAIRGGVPLIFPQFAGLGPLTKHGFARTNSWKRVKLRDESSSSALFRLQDSDITDSEWSNHFVAEYAVTLGTDELNMRLSIHNTGRQTFSFTAALHTYLRIHDISRVSITGLQGLRYSDSAAGGTEAIESAPLLYIADELDRIYFSTVNPLRVIEPGQRTVEFKAVGFADTVIWNPGAEKSAALTDMEPDGFRHMICVESAAIGVPVELTPGANWSGTQQLRLV